MNYLYRPNSRAREGRLRKQEKRIQDLHRTQKGWEAGLRVCHGEQMLSKRNRGCGSKSDLMSNPQSQQSAFTSYASKRFTHLCLFSTTEAPRVFACTMTKLRPTSPTVAPPDAPDEKTSYAGRSYFVVESKYLTAPAPPVKDDLDQMVGINRSNSVA